MDNSQLKNRSTKPRKSVPHSGSWWYYFEKVDFGAKAQCLHCDWISNRGKSKSTHILRYHLQNRHPELYAQKCQFSDASEIVKISVGTKNLNDGETSTLDQKTVKTPIRLKLIPQRSSNTKSVVHAKNTKPDKIEGEYYDEDGCEETFSAHHSRPLLYDQNSSIFYASDGNGCNDMMDSTNCEADGMTTAEELFLQQQNNADAEAAAAESNARMEIYALKKRKLQIEIQTAELLQENARFENELLRTKLNKQANNDV